MVARVYIQLSIPFKISMKKIDKIEVKKRIHEEITRAEQDINRLAASVKPVSPDNAIGRISRMEAISARGVSKSALSQARVRLAGLKSALKNLDEPEFGSCFECGEQIPLARILLMPQSKMCVACAESAE